LHLIQSRIESELFQRLGLLLVAVIPVEQ